MREFKVLVFTIVWLILCCGLSRSQVPNLENVGDILQSLKDSGMMDKFEKDLKQMLFDKKEPAAGASVGGDVEEPPFDVYEFIKAYVGEKKIKFNEKAMLYLMELPIGEDLHSHLAKLTIILDKIGDISSLNKKQVDAKVIETVKRVKSLAVMKTSLEKIYNEAVQSTEDKPSVKTEAKATPKPVEKPKAEPPKKAAVKKNEASEEVTEAITTFLEMVKAKPEQMINVITTFMSAYNIVSPSTLKTVSMYAQMAAKMDYFNTVIDVLINWIETASETEWAQQVVEILPSLAQAKTPTDVFNLLSKSFNFTADGLAAMTTGPDSQNKAIEALSSILVSTIDVVHGFLTDEMKLTFVNTFLLSQGFPALNSRKMVKSGVRIADKMVTVFTPWEVDVKKHEKPLSDFVASVEDKYVSWADYGSLDEEARRDTVKRFLTDTLIEPGTYLWSIYQAIGTAPQCAETLLCELNTRMRSESILKSATTRGLSLLASWAWTTEGNVDYPKLSEAIWTESSCAKLNPKDDPVCKIFPWQMSLLSDGQTRHNEL